METYICDGVKVVTSLLAGVIVIEPERQHARQLPLLSDGFQLTKDFVHVIDDETRFYSQFGRSIMIELLDLPVHRHWKSKREKSTPFGDHNGSLQIEPEAARCHTNLSKSAECTAHLYRKRVHVHLPSQRVGS
ncbi:hypothetical protein ABBQ38_012363 [Trebouxia sp. C0009 RCD-2024]